jgi:hypothetical protein
MKVYTTPKKISITKDNKIPMCTITNQDCIDNKNRLKYTCEPCPIANGEENF